MDYNYKVCVRCDTFNHMSYIQDTISGFNIQVTDFPIVFAIIDDASTDGEQDFLQDWADTNLSPQSNNGLWEVLAYGKIAVGKKRDNPLQTYVILLLAENLYSKKMGWKKSGFISCWIESSKYIGMCEGDDCWTVPDKLRRQVNYLDNHPSVNICTHNAVKEYCDTGKRELFNASLDSGVFSIKDVIGMKWFTPTASFLYRNNISISPLWRKNNCNGDMAILYSNLLKGDLYYDSDDMSVYRYGTPSSLSTASNARVLYLKKLNMYNTLDAVSEHKYHNYILKEIFKLKVYNCPVFRLLNSLRIRIREKLMG